MARYGLPLPLIIPLLLQMDVFLSLLLPQPEHVTASWQIEAATENYLRPFLDSFPINFTVKSQVVHETWALS